MDKVELYNAFFWVWRSFTFVIDFDDHATVFVFWFLGGGGCVECLGGR